MRPKTKNGKKRAFSILIRVVLVMAIVSLAGASVPLAKGYSLYKESTRDTCAVEVVDAIKVDEDYTNIENLPAYYLNAVIAVEDHRFFWHTGIDIISIGRATFNNLKHLRFVEGGSTITQQFAKNTFFTQDREIVRKVAEAFMAFDLERLCSKKELLELYVNTIYFGSGYYGVREAAIGYFGKEPCDLTFSEATMLAGIPNAPSVYGPAHNSDLAKQRQRQVIDRMIKYGYPIGEGE